MAETSKLYRCTICPGIAEIRSNVKFMLGGYSLDFRSEQSLPPESSSEVCITSLVKKDIPHRRSQTAIEVGGQTYGEFKENTLQYGRSLFGTVKPQVQLEGLHNNPTLIVNRSYYKLAKIKIGDWYPLGVFVRDLLPIELLIRGYVAIHAAAFCAAGKAMLIVGLPGIGKSTVLFKALKQGFQFLTEDMIIMDSNGYLHSCSGASSFSIELGRIRESFRYDRAGFLRSWGQGFLSKAPLLFGLTDWPYLDILSFFPQAEYAQGAEPRYIFILAKGEKRIEKLSPVEALRMLVAINRHTFAYPENRLLLRYSLLNPWLNISELMQTEEKLLQKLVNGSTSFLCVAPTPDEQLALIQQSI